MYIYNIWKLINLKFSDEKIISKIHKLLLPLMFIIKNSSEINNNFQQNLKYKTLLTLLNVLEINI